MRILTVSDFVERVIPQLVNGKERLSAIFASYRQIGRYEDGLVETRNDRLRILVQSGHLEYSGIARSMLCSFNMDLAQLGSDVMTEEGRESQQILQEKLAQVMPAAEKVGADILVVVYAGIFAFDEAIAYARSVRGQYPQATVVVLTCDCDLRSKERTLAPLLDSGEINHVVVTDGCGGMRASGEMVDGLISAWPIAVTA